MTRTPISLKRYLIMVVTPLFVVASLISGLILSSVFAADSTTLQATKLQDLVNQKNELQKQIEAKKKEAEEKKKQADAEKKRQAELASSIKRLDGDISATENRISDTQSAIQQTQQAVEAKKAEIAAKEQDILKKKEETYETAIEYHIELDYGNEFFAVIGSDRISSVLDRTNDLTSLSDKLVLDGEELDREKQTLLSERLDLEQKEQSLKTQKNQLAAYERALNGQKEQKVVLVGESKEAQERFISESAEATRISEQLKKQFAAVANEEAAMRRAASKRGGATAARSSNPSALGFVWPTDGSITTYFGGSTPFQAYHTGLDIANAAGTGVVAAASGKVVRTDLMQINGVEYGYGNWIEIQHDNGYVTRYAHLMEFLVTPGERVERGQIIAYMGGGRGMKGAGWSTGPHLHFELWDAQGPDDPIKYLP